MIPISICHTKTEERWLSASYKKISHQNPNVLAPQSQTSSLQNCGNITLCCLRSPICRTLLWQSIRAKADSLWDTPACVRKGRCCCEDRAGADAEIMHDDVDQNRTRHMNTEQVEMGDAHMAIIGIFFPLTSRVRQRLGPPCLMSL